MLRGRGRATAAVAALAVAAAGQAGVYGHPAEPARTLHRVARGETLSAIAVRYGVSPAALANANDLADPDRIRAGQRLVVLAGTGSPGRIDLARLPARLRERPERLALLGTFDDAARRHRVPADLLKALTWLESGWRNDAVSPTGAVGIGQLMPATVAFVNQILLRRELDPGQAAENIELAARFLGYLLAQTGGSHEQALASYYQGLASVRRYGPGGATRRYVADVLALRGRF